ncbi:hypothetical protein CASFOL_008078 [Castilleja foliolosa]|uniref:Bifunctional inhibitor/plant lipid transfer protein/seed storage helical domain-containing protein n=1 Tax=Castilleja foliolosa TaxID=1961234 RepID=A0ABD3E1X3_9LAMI
MGCMELSENFNQCFSFIEGLSRNPTNQCCRKIANLNSFAKKYNGGARTICKCIQKYASFYAQRPFDAGRIQELPIKCKTKLSFPISQHMDCSSLGAGSSDNQLSKFVNNCCDI